MDVASVAARFLTVRKPLGWTEGILFAGISMKIKKIVRFMTKGRWFVGWKTTTTEIYPTKFHGLNLSK